jgi:hypothetical protein
MTSDRTTAKVWRRAASLLCWLACVAVVLPLLAPAARSQGIPSNLRAAILLRALQYEKTFASASEAASLLVLSGPGGARDGAEMTAAMRQLAQAGAVSRKLSIEELRDQASAAEVQKRAPAVLYVAEGNEEALAVAAAVPRAIVLCGNPSAVGKGCMLSVEVFGSSSRLVVDTTAATKKGLTFDARMLRVARVIR